MLKWAITEPRQSYFPDTSAYLRTCSLSDLNAIPTSTTTRYAQSQTITPRALSRQSVESSCLQLNDKENQITSTPLLSCASPTFHNQSPKEVPNPRKLESFRDLSNIYPPTEIHVTPQSRSRRPVNTPACSRYASTLPTLDVNEYSPSCALIPGPVLALRGIGIPDAYFEKPRYLTQSTVGNKRPNNVEITPPKSLSSSQMDDSCLERMIDAIIASSQREQRVPPKLGKPTQSVARLRTMSPTYTPAFDPASDLDEIWWNTERTYIQGDDVTLAHPYTYDSKDHHHSEHLLCTPKSHKFEPLEESAFKRRRQRPVRRKRKLTTFRNKVKKSARKLLRVGSHNGMPQLDEDTEHNSNTQLNGVNINTSADSSHNSSSGDSSKTEDIEQSKNSNEVVEITKRRLSFSKNHCN